MCLFHGLLLVQALSALVSPSVSVISPLFYSTFHTLIMVARRGFEHFFSRLWAWRAAVTLYVRYGVWRHGLVGSKGFGGLEGSGGAESEARPRRITCMTTCEWSEQQAYWGEAEEEDDWVYDAPADSYHVASAYPATHGPGHTPRRYGNTHDDGSNEARVHWTNAGEDHRCSHQGCTHYHWGSVIGWKFGANNQTLVRLILGHSANRLLLMDLKDLKKSKCANCGRRMRLSTSHFRLFFSLFLHAAACPSLIRHSVTNSTSLPLPRCRPINHEGMAFFVFCGHMLWICRELSRHQIR